MFKVSVIVPVYNGEKYIKACIESILKQTLKSVEIIIVNDGSSDNTSLVLDEYQNNNNIIILNQKNMGPGAARNNGISKANGKYIAFCDVDDTFEVDMLEKMFYLAEEEKCDVVVCGYKNIDRDKYTSFLPEFNSHEILNRDEIKDLILKKVIRYGGGIFASACNKIYSKDLIVKNKIGFGVNRIYGEDWFYNQRVLGKVQNIGFIKEELYNYNRVNSNSIMNSFHSNLFQLHLESRLFLKERLIEWGLEDEISKREINTRFNEKVLEVIINEMNPLNKKKILKKIQYIKSILNEKEVVEAVGNSEKNIFNTMIKSKKYILLSILGYYRAVIKVKLYRLINSLT